MKILQRLIAVLALSISVMAQLPPTPPTMLDVQFAPGTAFTQEVAIGSGPYFGMTFFRLDFAPVPNTAVQTCTITLDTQINGNWTIGGAITSQSCATAGNSFAGPIVADRVRINAYSTGYGTVRVRLSGSLSTLATSGSGTISGVTAGSGLVGGGASGSVSLALLTTCTNGQVLISTGGLWACGANGAGISLGTNAQIPIMNSGATAYVPQTLTGVCTITNAGVVACPSLVVNTTTVNGHVLSSNVTVTATDVGLGSVSNNLQTNAAIMPNTAPGAGFIPIGNAGGTAYVSSAISGACSLTSAGVLACNYVPPTITVNGHALSGNVTVTASDVGLGSVTNDVQTKAAVMPNTAPGAGFIPVGNAGGTAYIPVAMSGPCNLSSAGVIACAGFALTSTTVNGHALSSNVTVTAGDVGLGSVSNNLQTNAAIMPNTAPGAGFLAIGNAGGTAYAPSAVTGDITLTSAGVSKLVGVFATQICTGFSAAVGNALTLVNTGSPNPCWGAVTPSGSGTVSSGTANQLGFYAASTNTISSNPRVTESGVLFTVAENTDLTGSVRVRGPDPSVDVLHPTNAIVGDAKISKNVNVSGTTVTIIGGSVNFAAIDCQSGVGCSGSVNKIIGFNAGGPSGSITVSAPTPGGGGNLLPSINYRYQFSEIIDTGSLGSTGDTVNGWTLATGEATVAEGANSSLAFPAASANVTNGTGIRLYVTGGFGPAANSGEEVLQVPGKVAFGTVTAGGTGCTTGPVSLTVGAPSQAGGIQAVAHATCVAGALTSVIIDITGSGYTSNPTATPTSGTGTTTLTLGLRCSAQSATNFRDSACDIGSTQTMASVTMVGPPVPSFAGWRSVLNAFTSTTQASIADTIPNNISGGANFAAWMTDNTAAWNANVLAFGPCNPSSIGTIATAGCHVTFPGVGSNGAPTGRYGFLNGLTMSNNAMTVEGRGGRGSPPNGGIAVSTQPTPSAEIVTLGDAYAINIGSNTGSLLGAKIINLAAEDLLPGASWGCYNVGGDFGVSLTATHVQMDEPTCVNFSNGYGILMTNIQRSKINDPWIHAATAFRFSDSVSATMVQGGLVSGAANTTGLGWGLWISNNPIAAINQFGNVKMFGTQFIDFYQGFRRISDSSYNQFYAVKGENISLTGGAACPGGGTACYGISLLTEGNTSGRCVSNSDYSTQSARDVNYLSETIPNAGGTACSATDVVDPVYTASTGSICAQTPCNLNDASLDLRLGNNSGTLTQASMQAGGQSWGPDYLSGATPAINCAKGNVHIFKTMGQNVVPTFNSASCTDGQEITIEVTENGTGGFTFTFPAAFTNTTPITTTANASTTEIFHWDATNAVAVRDGGTGSGGTISATNGGTGISNPTAHSLLVTEGSSAMNLVTSPIVNGFYVCGFNVASAPTPVDPSCSLSGIPVISETGASDTLAFNFRGAYVNVNGGSTFGLTLPTIGSGNLASNLPFVIQNQDSGNLTITSTSPNSIDSGSSGGSITILPKFAAFMYQDVSGPNWFSLRLPTFAAFPPCADTTGNHLNFTTAGGFTCGTSSSGGTGAESSLTGATAAQTITETGATFSITRSGVATGALTYPWVILNANATNTTSGALFVGTTGAGNAQVPLVVNEATVAGNIQEWHTGDTIAAGVVTVGTKVAQLGPTGTLTLGTANCVTFGSAGAICSAEGTPPTNVSGTAAFYPDSTTHEYEAATAGSNSFGILNRSIPAPANETAKTATDTAKAICTASAGGCNVAGQYHVFLNVWGSGTACSSVTAGSVVFTMTWVDEQGTTHTAVPMAPFYDFKTAAVNATGTFNFNTSLATEGSTVDMTISTNGSAAPTVTGTYTPCTTGTGTYNFRATMTRLQ